MTADTLELTAHPRGTTLRLVATPGARRDALLGPRSGALRVAVTAAPERGRANEAVLDLLAEALSLKRARLELLHGASGRKKVILIHDLTPDALRALIAAALAPPADR
jgi:hypothetical protein